MYMHIIASKEIQGTIMSVFRLEENREKVYKTSQNVNFGL